MTTKFPPLMLERISDDTSYKAFAGADIKPVQAAAKPSSANAVPSEFAGLTSAQQFALRVANASNLSESAKWEFPSRANPTTNAAQVAPARS